MRTCPVCYQKFTNVDAHLRADHPQYEVRIVNEAGESMSSVGYFQGSPPDWLKTANGKTLDKLKTTSSSEVAKRLRQRADEHQRKSGRALTEAGRSAHAVESLYVKVIEG